jgi:hypothetical protein
MPIHPSQLTTNNHIIMEEKEQENETKISPPIVINEIKKDNDDHLFKRPFLPTPYTVEEPSENTNKRASRMKRSEELILIKINDRFYPGVILNQYDLIAIC